MLSEDDRQQLEMIGTYLEAEDPGFARGLRDGRPRRPRGDCRWPLVVVLVLASTVFVTGQLVEAVTVMLAGAAATASAAALLWLRVRRGSPS